MISALHLLWIVPVSLVSGMALAALFTAGEERDVLYKERNNSKRGE